MIKLSHEAFSKSNRALDAQLKKMADVKLCLLCREGEKLFLATLWQDEGGKFRVSNANLNKEIEDIDEAYVITIETAYSIKM
jgi:hypothetical protein